MIGYFQMKDAVALIKKANYVFIIGNGGSAATANHFANDLVKLAGIKAISLCANIAVLTAYANDNGYENIFSAQLEIFLNSSDALITISCSGKSKNITRALKVARNKRAGVYQFPTMEDYGCDMQEAENKHLELAHSIAMKLTKA